MKVWHELSCRCLCPVNGEPDVYLIIIETDTVIKVEDILDAAAKLSAMRLFQEEFTERLARSIGATLTTVGFHTGVKTTCRVGHE